MRDYKLVAKRSFLASKVNGRSVKIIPAQRLVRKQAAAGRHNSACKRVVKNLRCTIRNVDAKAKQNAEQQANDTDVLVLDTDIEFPELKNAERGRLLRQSTLKPAAVEPPAQRQPDPLPSNSVDTVKRVVRFAGRGRETSFINVNPLGSTEPKTVSIGIQVGTPSTEIGQRYVPAVVTPAPEPPLRSYWTHKVNLPYPPAQSQAHYVQYAVPSTQLANISAPFYQQQALGYQHHTQLPQIYTRRNRRNLKKNQKYKQRKAAQQQVSQFWPAGLPPQF